MFVMLDKVIDNGLKAMILTCIGLFFVIIAVAVVAVVQQVIL